MSLGVQAHLGGGMVVKCMDMSFCFKRPRADVSCQVTRQEGPHKPTKQTHPDRCSDDISGINNSRDGWRCPPFGRTRIRMAPRELVASKNREQHVREMKMRPNLARKESATAVTNEHDIPDKTILVI